MSKKTDKFKREVVFYFLSTFIKKNYSKFIDIRGVFLNYLNPDSKYNREDRNISFSRFFQFFKRYLIEKKIFYFFDRKTNCHIIFRNKKSKDTFFKENN